MAADFGVASWMLAARRLDRPVEATSLIVSELVTNALLHGHGPTVGVCLRLTDTHLYAEVEDGSEERSVLRTADPLAECGRGLALVAHHCDEWGVSKDGTVTWCCLALNEVSVLQPTSSAGRAPVPSKGTSWRTTPSSPTPRPVGR
ncbi:ATP-binding protein [Streptomyces lydicus]